MLGATATMIIVMLMLVLLSPLGLDILTRTSNRDWAKISDASQAYTAAGAILSALAFAILAAALIFQIRQTRIAQLQVARTIQNELIKLALTDNYLAEAWGPVQAFPEHQRRRFTYLNLVFKYFQTGYVIGEFTEATARRTLSNRFKYELGRAFWKEARSSFKNDANGRRQRAFYRLAEEEYQRALKTSTVDEPHASRSENFPRKRFVIVGGIALASLALGWLARGRKS